MQETVEVPRYNSSTNQTLEVPQAQSTDNVVDIPVHMQRQVPAVQVVRKTVEDPQTQFIDGVVDTPVVQQRQVPTVQTAQKTMENLQAQFLDEVVGTPVAVQHQVSMVADAPQLRHIPTNTNEKGRWSQTVPDRMVQETERSQDKGEANEAKIDAKNASEDYCFTMKNTLSEEKLNLNFEGRDKERMKKAAEEAVRSPQSHFIEKLMDIPAGQQRQVHMVEVARVIPQELVKPSGERASVRERIKQFQMNGDMLCTSTVEAPRVTPDDKQSEDPEDEAPHKRRKQESKPDLHAPVHFSLCDGSSNQEVKSVDDSAELETRPRGMPVGQLDDVLLEVRDVKSELLQVRELVGVLVRRERCAEVKTEVAARRLERMEREKDNADDAEHEANLEEALADQTKAVKMVVDKWFVDRGFGFGKTTTGEVVFIHASVVQGAEVLMVGTDAWAQVVNDHARAEGGYRARRAWGRNAWRQEKEREKANRVAQQVRRAAALTAELAVQSERRPPRLCDQPPGLDELAGHIEAPNMGAGGSHPQATMMPDPWATYSRPSANSEVSSSTLLNQVSFVFPGRARGARPKSTTRAQDNAAMLEETLSLFVKATGKDEASMREQLVSKRPEELRLSREFWRTRAEETQRFQEKKKEAWEFFRRLAKLQTKETGGFRRGIQAEGDDWILQRQL